MSSRAADPRSSKGEVVPAFNEALARGLMGEWRYSHRNSANSAIRKARK
jgi:hypothetical protein